VTDGARPGDEDPILAGGGVVWRPARDGGDGDGLEVLVIHRPRYDDWTLPKGKVEYGDADLLATACREVREETGLEGHPGADLGEIGYVVRGRPKIVHYWSMEAGDGTFTPNAEVDEAEWLPPQEARARLVHPHDVEVIDRFLASWV
jgi:8-oxo-dGTP diphosphatase